MFDVWSILLRYAIGKDGNIAYKGGLGPDDYNLPELAQFLNDYFQSDAQESGSTEEGASQ